MALRKVAVDAGRSSIKSVILSENGGIYDSKKLKIDSKLGFINFNNLKTRQTVVFNEKKDILCKIDNTRELVIGQACDMLLTPDKILSVTIDESFIKYSIKYVLVSVAKLVNDGDDIILSINLTYNNNNKKNTDFIKKELEGEHKVIFYNSKGNIIVEISFSIKKIYVFNQGWVAVMNTAIDDETLKFDDYYKDNDGLVMDVGRKTTDVVWMRKLAQTSPKSFEYATESIFAYIRDQIQEDFAIQLNTKDIEKQILLDKKFLTREGKEVHPRKYLKDAIINIAENISSEILENFSLCHPEWVILTGGGSQYFKDVFQPIYTNLKISEDFIFGNAMGMLKMLKKYSKK